MRPRARGPAVSPGRALRPGPRGWRLVGLSASWTPDRARGSALEPGRGGGGRVPRLVFCPGKHGEGDRRSSQRCRRVMGRPSQGISADTQKRAQRRGASGTAGGEPRGARFSRQRDLRSAASPGRKLRRPFFPALCVLLLLFSGLQEPAPGRPGPLSL